MALTDLQKAYLANHNHNASQILDDAGAPIDTGGGQPADQDLTDIAALSPANNDVMQRKSGAWTNRTIAQLLTDLGIAAAYQPLDSDLTALAGLAIAADKLPYGSGSHTMALADFTAAARSLLDDADAATMRATLGLADAGLTLFIGDGVNAITTGFKGRLRVPYACTIVGNEVVADASGSIAVTISKSTYANIGSESSIVASAKPTLSSAQKSTDSTLTGWTTALSKGDYLYFNVDSATTVKQVSLSLVLTR